MNTYIIDMGPVCLPIQAEKIVDVIIYIANFTNYIKPGIAQPEDWTWKQEGDNLLICNYKNIEVRVYSPSRTINLENHKSLDANQYALEV